jgi:hypothetical protein
MATITTALATLLCGGSAASSAFAMTVQDFLSIPQTMEDSAEVKQYLTGFRDGLYDFNGILDSAGIRVVCPPACTPPIDVSELRNRMRSDIETRQASDPGFAAFARDTNLGLIAVEVLGGLYPCEDEPAAGGGQAE